MMEEFVSVSIDSLGNEKTQDETTLVRPVGAIERMFYRYAERNPVHFSLAAEFDIVLAEDQLRAAAEELARPFDRSTAPLLRAVLLNGQSSSALLLTFDHTIADGISSVIVLKDLVDSLNGHHLTPCDVPPSQEEAITLRLPSSNHQPIPEPAVPGARMLKPCSIRPFDGTRPHVRTVALRGPDTSRLVNRCRAEQTTVHAAIVAASSRVRATLHGEDFFRVASPINIRPTINVGDGCADNLLPPARRRI
jgi:hypothetical protein